MGNIGQSVGVSFPNQRGTSRRKEDFSRDAA
jgi:hypothetical protein